jgi:transmembrane 9 superfamily protein 2/4
MFGMFWLLWLNVFILIAVVSLMSVLMTYMTLQSQNWDWWWRSFNIGATAGVWMMIWSIYAMSHVFKMNFIAGEVIYLLYMLVCSAMFSLICGTVSLTASFLFVTRIYSGVKIE